MAPPPRRPRPNHGGNDPRERPPPPPYCLRMSLELPHRDAHAARRDRLAAALGARPALIVAGGARPRNYAANVYPYRAASHFLYLFGLPLRGGAGLYDGEAWTLYLPDSG